ncbi:MAG: hypothetical protein FWE88_01610 [Phycisphaerae bacterium]|nr:hypothetical protein [Phycisphaerae bacterium]
MENNEDIVRVGKIPFDEHLSIGQLRKLAKQWFKEKYKHNNKFVNEDTGQTIEVSGSGIGHTIREAQDVLTIYSLDVLPEMIARMKWKGFEQPKERKDGKPNPENFLGIERYETRVQVRGNTYTAYFVVKVEEIGGKKVGKMERLYYYNHHIK